MNTDDIRKTLDQLTLDIDTFADPHAVAALKKMLNLAESLVEYNAILGIEEQKQKNEISRLKGKQDNPNICKQSTGKQRKIKIDRQVICKIDKALLPEDAVFVGYQTQIVQDIKISPNDLKLLINKCMRK